MYRNAVLIGIIVSLTFVITGTIWLSHSDETLDRVARQIGAKESPIWNPPIPNYELPGYGRNAIISVLVGFISAVFVLGVSLIVGRALKKGTNAGGRDKFC